MEVGGRQWPALLVRLSRGRACLASLTDMTSFDAFDAHRMQMDNIDNNSQVEPPHSLAVATVNVKITEVVLPFSESETRPRAAVNPGRSLSLFLSHTQSRRQEMWSGFIGDAGHALEGDVVEVRAR